MIYVLNNYTMKYKYKKLIFHFKMDFPGNDTRTDRFLNKKKIRNRNCQFRSRENHQVILGNTCNMDIIFIIYYVHKNNLFNDIRYR